MTKEIEKTFKYYCNYAVEKVLGDLGFQQHKDYERLHSMWEDRDLEGYEKAVELIEFMGKGIVVVYTGDYITPSCGHYECETYDARYVLYVFKKKAFKKIEKSLKEVDAEWRKERMKCRVEEGRKKFGVITQ